MSVISGGDKKTENLLKCVNFASRHTNKTIMQANQTRLFNEQTVKEAMDGEER